MDFEVIKSWFAKWTCRKIRNCRLLGIFAAVLAPVALVAATTAVYWLLRLMMHNNAGNLGDARTCLYVSLGILPCLFVGNRLAPRRDLMEEQLTEGPSVMVRRKVIPLLFLWFLFAGPRLVDWSARLFRDARFWREVDVHCCGAVLWILMSKPGKVSYDEIQQKLDWLDLNATMLSLYRIPGIVFLRTQPPGMSLTQDFRQEVREELGMVT